MPKSSIQLGDKFNGKWFQGSEIVHEAKEYVKCVNKTGVDCFQKTEDTTDEKTVRHEGDVFEMTTK